MIEVIERDGNIICFQVKGKLTHDDYERVFIPEMEQTIKEHGKLRILFAMEEEFHGWEAKAAWDDAKFGINHRTDFEKCAIVGGPKWLEWATKVSALIIPCEFKTFPPGQIVEAKNWLRLPVQSSVE